MLSRSPTSTDGRSPASTAWSSPLSAAMTTASVSTSVATRGDNGPPPITTTTCDIASLRWHYPDQVPVGDGGHPLSPPILRAPRIRLFRNSSSRSGLSLASNIGFDEDRGGLGHGRAHGDFRLVDRMRQFGHRERVVEVDLRRQQKVVGSQVHRAKVDDRVDLVGRFYRRIDFFEVARRGRFTDQQWLHLARKQYGDDDEQ